VNVVVGWGRSSKDPEVPNENPNPNSNHDWYFGAAGGCTNDIGVRISVMDSGSADRISVVVFSFHVENIDHLH
jgi:hypothetical protein